MASLSPISRQPLPPLITSSNRPSHSNLSPRVRQGSSTQGTSTAVTPGRSSSSSNLPSIPLRTSTSSNFISSLPYTFVRDFAYPLGHPLHFGPPSTLSSNSATPSSSRRQSEIYYTGGSSRRLSDPQSHLDYVRWGEYPSLPTRDYEGAASLGNPIHSNMPPPLMFGDGPPWSEDEDLQSPVVISTKHRKGKSGNSSAHSKRDHPKRILKASHSNVPPVNNDGIVSGTKVAVDLRHGRKDANLKSDGASATSNHDVLANHASQNQSQPMVTNISKSQDKANGLPSQSAALESTTEEESDGNGGSEVDDDSLGDEDDDGASDEYDPRGSRIFIFQPTNDAEAVHGRAVALFDFVPENDNEVGLVQGQIIYVSYRHGQGWLVAEDPKTGESGLVPEEYVKLLRPPRQYTDTVDDGLTPTQPEHQPGSATSKSIHPSQSPLHSSAQTSAFSTSRQKDILPFGGEVGLKDLVEKSTVASAAVEVSVSPEDVPASRFEEEEELDASRRATFSIKSAKSPLIDDPIIPQIGILPEQTLR